MRRAYWNLLGMAALVAAMVAAGCGDDEPAEEPLECGPNTTLEDGHCVPEERCDDGEIVTPRGTCEPEDIFCGEGVAYDAELEKCVSLADVSCGEGTIEDDGRCVVEDPLHCGDGTVLVNETCELTDDVCGEGTELELPYCQPTDGACDAGAQWDVATGECVDLEAVSCGETTVEHDNACVPMGTLADELAADADIDHDDGEAIVPDDEDQFVFTGTMDDGLSHTFEFEGTEGQWLEVKVYPRGLPSPGFDFEEAESSWVRSTVAGMESLPSRTVLTPADGTFEFTVVTHLTDSDTPSAFGDEHWQYVGTVDVVEAPEAYEWDYQQENVDGDLAYTEYNFIEVDVSDTDELLVTPEYLGDDAEGVTLEAWASPDEFVARHDLEVGEDSSVDASDLSTVYLHVDAAAFYGSRTEFELRAMATETLVPNEIYVHEIEAEAGEMIFLSHENDQVETLDARVIFDNELQYETEALAGNDDSYSTTETNREFFYAAESGEYLVEFENTSSSDVTGFISTSYADKKPTFELDDEEPSQFEAAVDADGAEAGDWRFAVIETQGPAELEAAVDADTTSGPYIRVYDTDGEQLETSTLGEVDWITEEAAVFIVAGRPATSTISGDMEFSMEGRPFDLLEPGEIHEMTFDAETFDILHGHIGYDDGDHLDVRFLNPHGTIIFEETELSISDQWSIMELFPGPGEFTLQIENTGQSNLIGFEAELDISTSFDSLTLEDEAEYNYSREGIDEGESEFLIIQSTDIFSVTIDAFMGLDQEGALRVWNVSTGDMVAEKEDMLTVETTAFTEAGGIYAVEFEAITDIDDKYDLTLETAESSVFEVTQTASPDETIPEGGSVTSEINVTCPNIMDIEVYVDISHTYLGDLEVDLVAPSGMVANLHDGTGGASNDIDATYPYPGDSNLGDGEDLLDLEGTNGSGTWQLIAEDTVDWWSGDGHFNSWTLYLTCEG